MQQKYTSEVKFIMFLEDVYSNIELIIIPNKKLLVYNSKLVYLLQCPAKEKFKQPAKNTFF